MKRYFFVICALAIALSSKAVKFDDFFSDSTLRLDYIISGSPETTVLGKSAMHKSKGWHGRKNNLDSLLLAGNGDVTLKSKSGDVIYKNSFSTLFSEWMRIGDTVPTVGQITVLVPQPIDTAYATVNLYDNHHRVISSISHPVIPSDILIRQRPAKDFEYLRKGSYEGAKIGVAFLAEGYTQAEKDTFINDCNRAVKAILEHAPFDELRERFDFVAVFNPSAESGVSVPLENKWLNTPYGSHFSTFYSDRYLTSPEVFAMYDDLNGVPAQHIIVLANSNVYGGGGIFNDYTLTAAHHDWYEPVVVHEFGHSFGGLADEYFYDGDVMDNTYPLDTEPWEPNITTMVDFSKKWQGLLDKNTPVPTPVEKADKYPVGVYEGGGYSIHGVYRPADVCRMRKNIAKEFCPACQASLRNLILYYTE